MSQNTDAELSKLSAEIDSALGKARAGAILTIVLGLASIGLVGYWLKYAHDRFTTEITPEQAAIVAVAQVQETVPAYRTQFTQMVVDYAPKMMDDAEKKLSDIPDQLANTLIERTTAELDKLSPTVEDEIYKSLKVALAKAKEVRKPGESDEQHIKSMVSALGDVYEAESSKLLGETHKKYLEGASNIITYLDRLATNKGLDRKESLQRQALVTFLTLASRAKGL